MQYRKVRYKLHVRRGTELIDLGGLVWADRTGTVDDVRWHFSDPRKNLSFMVTIGGRQLNQDLEGHGHWTYTEEEIEVAMLLGIRDELARLFDESSHGALEAVLGKDHPVTADYNHLREAVRMVHAPSR